LVLAGGGGGKEFDAAAAVDRAGVGGSVLLLGRVPDQELPALMAGAEVFVYPSIYEGFGLPVLEAMACGAPVITSKSSSLAEVAGEAARLAEPESADDLSMALRELLGNRELRRELNMRGKERAARFGPGRCVQETLALYHDVLGHG
ncbi:MAG TPA: glycosyltransferase family 1 protein, partial [Planctomycetota bacterium]|nr:glycosyltransferase family 1 protein [Planctomycetota bacterium]